MEDVESTHRTEAMTQNRGKLEQGQETPEMDPHLQSEWQWVPQSLLQRWARSDAHTCP